MTIPELLTKAYNSKKRVRLSLKNCLGQEEIIVGVVTLVRPNAIGFSQDMSLEPQSTSSACKTFCKVILISDIFDVWGVSFCEK